MACAFILSGSEGEMLVWISETGVIIRTSNGESPFALQSEAEMARLPTYLVGPSTVDSFMRCSG